MERAITVSNAFDESENFIVIKQLPIIEEQLVKIKTAFENEVQIALSLDCSEETIQQVKQRRAAITRFFNAMEDKRKAVKDAIMEPYDRFYAVYQECITNVYKDCDSRLSARITEVQDRVKDQKRSEAEDYFDEYCQSKMIDFLTFDRTGIAVTLSASKKSLREQIKAFVDKVADELELIGTQEDREEVFIEYKKTLNVAQAITTVINRHKAIDEERARSTALAAAKEEQEKIAARVDEAVEPLAPPQAVAEETPAEEEATEPEPPKTYLVSFAVRGTIEQIRALKAFLTEGGYDYVQQ